MSSLAGSEPFSTAPGTTRTVRNLLIVLVALVAGAEIGTELWYRWHEVRAERNPPWTFVWPDAPESPIKASSRGFQEFAVAGKDILHFDRARGGAWLDALGNQWVVSVLEWDPGTKVSAMDSRHNPMICLPSTGMELESQLGEITVDTAAGPLPFRGYVFKRDGKPVYVFSAVIRPLALRESTYRSGRLERRITQLEKAINGNRQSPERIVLLALHGPRSPEEAQTRLKQTFDGFVQIRN